MPGIATHYIFGLEVYRELSHEIGASVRQRDAFLLGNQGPDPLFYLMVSPLAKNLRGLGSTMHSQKTPELLHVLHERFVARKVTSPVGALSGPKGVAGAVRAYAFGFLCHYLLDSTVHPLVYAQQYALCAAGLDGVKAQRLGRAVHATIETELDEYVMTTHLGVTAESLVPHKTALRCRPEDLNAISKRLADTAQRVYKTNVPPSLFATAVQLNRAGQGVLDSQGAGIRGLIGAASPGGFLNVYALTIVHENIARLRTAFANNDHTPWPHPTKEGEVLSASFDELYDQAFRKARDSLVVFADDTLTLSACKDLTAGINFLGREAD